MRLLLATLSIACLLSACGHKGPLYLPTAEDGKNASSNNTPKK